jgi:hypothetical protein
MTERSAAAMSAKTTTGRKAGSTARRPRALERALVVAAVAAVLVSIAAWIAMNRPGGGAEAAGAESSATTSGGTSAEATATDAGTGDQAAATAAQSSSTQSSSAASGDAAAGRAGTGTTGRSGAPAAPTGAATAPLSPTTAFLSALAASGLAPPIDDAQKLAMADDVCQEMGYGATYDDVVRALTFAGATDAEAANFARLAITHLCAQHTIG